MTATQGLTGKTKAVLTISLVFTLLSGILLRVCVRAKPTLFFHPSLTSLCSAGAVQCATSHFRVMTNHCWYDTRHLKWQDISPCVVVIHCCLIEIHEDAYARRTSHCFCTLIDIPLSCLPAGTSFGCSADRVIDTSLPS